MGATAVLRARAGVANELSGKFPNPNSASADRSNRSSNLADGISSLRIAKRKSSTPPPLDAEPRRCAILLAVLRTGLASTSPKHASFAAPSRRPGLGAAGGRASENPTPPARRRRLLLLRVASGATRVADERRVDPRLERPAPPVSICSVPGDGMGLKSIPEFDVAVVDDSFLSGDDASFADRRCCARCILASSRIRRAFPGEFNGPSYAPRANLFGDFIGDFVRAFAASVATSSRTESGDTRLLTSSSSVSKDESSSRHAVGRHRALGSLFVWRATPRAPRSTPTRTR